MASKELRIDNGSTSSDSSSGEEQQDVSMEEERLDTSTEEEPQDISMEEISPKSMPPKMRIKLSLRMPNKKSPETNNVLSPKIDVPPPAIEKEEGSVPTKPSEITTKDTVQDPVIPPAKPLNGNGEKETSASSTKKDEETENEDEEEVVQATVVNASDEGGGTDVDPVHVKAEPLPKQTVKTSAAAPKKKVRSRSPLPTHARAVRLPPLSSPGMLIPPSSGIYRGDADTNGYATPASVFDHCMSLAGYSTEARTEKPHRGSSVRRQVGDMFDSDVTLALNFPPLVPKELWSLPKQNRDEIDGAQALNGKEPSKVTSTEEKENDMKKEKEAGYDAARLLLRSLAPRGGNKEKQHTNSATNETSRKRRRPWQFSDMVPLSLTLPYPEAYIQKRLRYNEKVKERERAIVVSQEANEKYEEALERYTLATNAKRSTEELPPPPIRPKPAEIPPIPEPPSPPHLSELEGIDIDGVDESNHPICLPKNHEQFTAHLDPTCFEIANGRYFNILSNSIADPTFVGPNAPGIAGLNLAGGSGLATAYAGGGSSGGSASALNASYHGSVSGGSVSATGGFGTKSAGKKGASKKKSSASAPAVDADMSTLEVHYEAVNGGPPLTSTSTGLKKLMEDGGDEAQAMKTAIIRAAVYASRAGKHGMSFLATNGEVYPDVSKAFAAHAGVRPCSRCKNNKQGAYHCRLRRKHQDIDYDGGDSRSLLSPLFQEPLDDLLLKKQTC